MHHRYKLLLWILIIMKKEQLHIVSGSKMDYRYCSHITKPGLLQRWQFFPCFSSLSFGLSSCCLLVQSFSPFYLLGVQLCSISLGHHVLFIRSNLYWLYSGRQWGLGAGWFTPVIFNITMYKPLPQNSSSLFSFLFFSFWLNWSDFNNLKCKKMLRYI